ncbi:hypothetical protein BABINDRAFT_29256, partial [Babjeviella inositovora NRRL Y-12698]
IHIAVNGCCHGELGQIYAEVMRRPQRVELLVICGDFQALRNRADLASMAVPDKYKQEGDFYQYYDGTLMAPIPTILIGGNHESSRFLKELPHGGWVAPNIYYMGYTNVVWYRGVRIGGISGIFNEHNFMADRDISQRFSPRELRSVYHVRRSDFLAMLLLRNSVLDVMLSHDWPQGIEHFGNLRALLRTKPYFKKDIETGKLGNPALRALMEELRPKFWFAAHLHVYYEAVYHHSLGENEKKNETDISNGESGNGIEKKRRRSDASGINNRDEIQLDFDTNEVILDMGCNSDEEPSMPSLNYENNPSDKKPSSPRSTQFYALDKVLPRRTFLKNMDIPICNKTHVSYQSDSFQLYYDTEYIAILRFLQRF